MPNLVDYFKGIATKRLSEVEIYARGVSNGHEFNGTRAIKELIGTEKIDSNSTILYLSDEEQETIHQTVQLTWYDSRKDKPHRSSEYRLYYTSNDAMDIAKPGDILIVALKSDSSILLIIAKAGSTIERQLLWLFSLDNPGEGFIGHDIQTQQNQSITIVEREILEAIGIEPEIDDEDYWLHILLKHFNGLLPPTKEFTSFARSTVSDVSSIEDPDSALLAYLERETTLFRVLERHIFLPKIGDGFNDIDEFVNIAQSILQSRKSRRGYSLELHLQSIFLDNNLTFESQAKTEQNSTPDFLFPGIKEYTDPGFPTSRLTMLAAKSTCKERWNQVLAEANRIEKKHLITLEPSIAPNQTTKMQDKNIQLVIPNDIQNSYSPDQKDWLMSLSEFIILIKKRQLSV